MKFLFFILPICSFSQLPIGTRVPVPFRADMSVIHVYQDTTWQDTKRVLIVTYFDSVLVVVDKPMCFYQCKLLTSSIDDDYTYRCLFEGNVWLIRQLIHDRISFFITSQNKFPNYYITTYEINRH